MCESTRLTEESPWRELEARRGKRRPFGGWHRLPQPSTSRGCRRSMTSVRHGPDRLIALVVFVAFPRGTTNVQILVRGSRKHHPSAFVANRGRKPICRSIERPCDHPVRSYGNSGTGFIRRIGVASLCGAAQHVNHSGRCVRRLRLSLHGIHHPSHTHGVHAHRRVANFVFVSRCTNPLIRSFDQNGHGAVCSHFGDRRVFGHLFRTGEARSPNSLGLPLYQSCLGLLVLDFVSLRPVGGSVLLPLSRPHLRIEVAPEMGQCLKQSISIPFKPAYH